MSQFGNYKVVREIATRGAITEYQADRTTGDGPPEALVKHLNTAADPGHAEQATIVFFDSAREQQSAARSSPCWARVYDTGVVPGGAFVIAEYCSRSVQSLIDAQVAMSGSQIEALITQAARGLLDLQQLSARPHGNLMPSTIGVREDWPAGSHAVALADPLPATRVTPAHAAEDLRALGLILFQLVTKSAAQPSSALDYSSEWSALGHRGRSLLALCNLLLDASTDADFKYDTLRQRISGQARARKLMKLTAAALILGAVSVPGWVYGRRLVARMNGDTSAPRAGGWRTAGSKPTTTVTTTRAQVVTNPVRRDPIQYLLTAKNPSQKFNLKIDAEQYHSADDNEDYLSVTLSADADCNVMILCQDAEGAVTLLVPNGETGTQRLLRGQRRTVRSMGPRLLVEAPFGKTLFRAIATTRQVDLVGATLNRDSHLYEGGEGFCLADTVRRTPQPTLAALLRPEEWATAQVEIVTRAPSNPSSPPAPGGSRAEIKQPESPTRGFP